MRYSLTLTVLMCSIAPVAALAAAPAVIDLRVDKLEKEMHAVQRKVFPSGVPAEPEVSATPSTSAGNAASAPLADITQRVDLLEAQVKTLTGQIEQYTVRLKRVEDANKAQDARLKALEPVAATETPAPVVAKPLTAKPATTKPAVTTAKPVVAPKPVTPAKPAPNKKREALVAAVAVPDTGDTAEDSYTYGYRLFDAKLYPEAQVKLAEFVSKYPKNKRYSFAQNLLGRAYLEEGKNANAAKAFVENYTKMPKGERAAESLSWAVVALNKDNLPAKACRVYQEFTDVYGTKASKDAQARVAKGRLDAKCPS